MATKKPKKQEVVVAYKGFDKDMKCRDFQFEVGQTYTHKGDVEACKSGFHSCENPLDILNYYPLISDNGDLVRFAVVEATGSISRHGNDSKLASASISIKAELKLPEIVAAAIKWASAACTTKKTSASGDSSKLAASGDYSKLAASGYSSQLAASGYSSKLAASGDYSKLAASGYSSQLAASGDSSKLAASGDYSKLAASGYYSQLAASGDSSKLAASGYSSKLAASGDYSKLAASGDYSQLAASGDSSIVAGIATNCTASAGEKGCIVLTCWDNTEKRYRVSVGYVGENGIKPNTAYKLDKVGNFVEVAV